MILSKNDKYLFVELKSSNDPRLTKEEELNNQIGYYDDSYNLIKAKYLVVFKVHNIKDKTLKRIKLICDTHNFELIIINVKK